VSVAGVLGLERQPEPLHPAPGGPDLLGLKGVGQMIVLDPGQVPDQPGDRVHLGVQAERQLLGREAVDNPADDLTDPANGIDKQLGTGHRRLLGTTGSFEGGRIVRSSAKQATGYPVAATPMAARHRMPWRRPASLDEAAGAELLVLSYLFYLL
jgi:hypothetical protein